MLAAARQSALHSTTESATTALLEESSATTASSANVLRAATGEQLVSVGTASGAGVGASARLAVAEGLTAVGRAQAGGASLASQSILATEETLATLRGDLSNAFQAGFEDVLDTNPNLNPSSVTEQVKDLLPTFQSTAANVASAI